MGESEILQRVFFYQVVATWRGVILTVGNFSKAKNNIINIEHWLKSKLAWPVLTKEYGVKIKNGTGRMATAKNEVFVGLQHESCYLLGRITFGEWGQKFSGRSHLPSFISPDKNPVFAVGKLD